MALVSQPLLPAMPCSARPEHNRPSTYSPLNSVWHGEDAELLELMLKFYPRKNPSKILDATVNRGRFWNGSKWPVTGMDIDPRYKPDVVGDNTDMPFEDATFDVVVYDPPHIPNQGKDKKKDFQIRFGLVVNSPKENGYSLSHTFPPFLKEAYREPVKPKLISERIKAIRAAGVPCVVSTVPARAEERAELVQKAGADVLVVQGTVLTARHSSRSYHQLAFDELVRACDIPVVVGNCVQYDTALELMETGIAGILVGVGPGAACTTRGVLGVGVPQVTATADVAAARDEYMRRGGVRVAVITDGGMRIGADVCKAFASGADAVMIGTPLAGSEESASKGFNWGMATPDPNLPRGTRIHVGTKATLREILLGPARVDDGTQNFAGALRSALGVCGARDIAEFQHVEMVIAPSIVSEGKVFQQAQHVGMGKS